MNALIELGKAHVLGVYTMQRAKLSDLKLSNAELRALIDECNGLTKHEEYSVQTAAVITRAAAVMILEERG